MNAPTDGRDEPAPPAAPAAPNLKFPRLVALKRPGAAATADATPAPIPAPIPPAPTPAAPPPRPPGVVKLPVVASVVPVEWLRGRASPDPDLDPPGMVRAVLAAAGARPDAARYGEIVCRNGGWECRFLTTIDPRIARVRLGVLWEQDKTLTVKATQDTLVMRRLAPPPLASQQSIFASFSKKGSPESGFEVVVQFPEPGRAISEVVATGRVFGSPPPEFATEARQAIAALLDGARGVVEDVPERRVHPRFAAEFPLTLYPIHPDGRVETPQTGRCLNVSAGGLALRTGTPPPTKYAYVAFEGARGTAGLALLLRVLRTTRTDNGLAVAGRFKLELWPDEKK